VTARIKLFGAALEARRLADRTAKVQRARGNSTGLTFEQRLAIDLAKAAAAAKKSGAGFQPRPGAYIAPDPKTGKPGLRSYEDMAGSMIERGDTAAQEIEDLYPTWQRFGRGPRQPDVTQGNMSPAPRRGPPAAPRMPVAPPAPPAAPRPPGARAQRVYVDPDDPRDRIGVIPGSPDEAEVLRLGWVPEVAGAR
jgi:hypothetical protein